nr:MAG TPA: hypothetical protein [Bacteriophage sp.]
MYTVIIYNQKKTDLRNPVKVLYPNNSLRRRYI